jgi:hypothetical protein
MEKKPFYLSVTFWGIVLSVVGAGMNHFGIENPFADPDVADEIAVGATVASGKIVEIIGFITIVVGRFRSGSGKKLTLKKE